MSESDANLSYIISRDASMGGNTYSCDTIDSL